MPMYDENGLTATEREERKTLVNSVFNGYPSLETKMLAEKLEDLEAEKRKLKVEIGGKGIAGVFGELEVKLENQIVGEVMLNPSECELSGTFENEEMSDGIEKLQKIRLEIWNNELKERKEIQQRAKDSNGYIRPFKEVDKIVTKLTDESVYGYYDCLHIYYNHGENGAREILKAGKENMVTADDLIVISDFMADDRLNDLPRKLNELNTKLAGVNKGSTSKEKKLPRKLRKGW